MCNVMLSYDSNNAKARQSLAALLATGLFTQVDASKWGGHDLGDVVDTDVSDIQTLETFMEKSRQRMPKRNMSIEEASDFVVSEIRSIYEMKNAI